MSESAVAPESTESVLRSIGGFASRAIRGAGAGIAAAYRSVDSDVPKHLAELPLLGLMTLAPRRPPVAALPDDGHRPVIFVHGLGGNRGNFTAARLFLRINGRKRTYALGFTPKADLEAMAAELRQFIDEVCTANQLAEGAQVDVVAHSMGGVVARLAIEDERTRSRIATLVTMGTPHAGTYAARYAQTPFTLALRPDSEVMKRLAQQLPWSGAPRLVTFWSDSDVFLLPASTACVDGAENIELPGTTHYGYLLQPVCFQKLVQVLSREARVAVAT